MNQVITGGCACGGVRYEVHGKLRDVITCHCVQCRRTSGHFVAATACRRSTFKLVQRCDTQVVCRRAGIPARLLRRMRLEPVFRTGRR